MKYGLAVAALIVGLVLGALWGPLKLVTVKVETADGRASHGLVEGPIGYKRAIELAQEACGAINSAPAVETIYAHVSSSYGFECS